MRLHDVVWGIKTTLFIWQLSSLLHSDLRLAPTASPDPLAKFNLSVLLANSKQMALSTAGNCFHVFRSKLDVCKQLQKVSDLIGLNILLMCISLYGKKFQRKSSTGGYL